MTGADAAGAKGAATAAPFQRARKPSQKAQRRETILQAAAELVEEERLEEVGLNSIARRSGISKANLYRYFESREEILLQLFLEDLEGYVEEVESGLALLAGGDERASGTRVEDVAGVLTDAFLARPRLCRLLGVLQSVLEQNVSEGSIAKAKVQVLDLSRRAADAMSGALPGVPLEDCAWANSTIALLVAGLWPAANPAPNATRVLDREQFKALKPDMERDLRKAIVVLFQGLWKEGTSERSQL